MHDGQGPEQVGGEAVGRWGSGVRWEVGKQGSKRRGGGRWGHGRSRRRGTRSCRGRGYEDKEGGGGAEVRLQQWH